MKVYTFKHNLNKNENKVRERAGVLGFNFAFANQKNSRRRNNYKTFGNSSLLENSFLFQVLAIFGLTIAVFLSVQGIFNTGNDANIATAKAANENVKLIINYNTSSINSTILEDNSKVIEMPQP